MSNRSELADEPPRAERTNGSTSVHLTTSRPLEASNSQLNATWAWLSGGFFLFLASLIVMEDLGRSSSVTWAVRALPLGDKISHFTLFGVFTYGVNRALGFPTWRLFSLRVPWVSVLILLAVTIEELSQHFFPHRTLDLDDWLADLAGIVLFSWLARRRTSASSEGSPVATVGDPVLPATRRRLPSEEPSRPA